MKHQDFLLWRELKFNEEINFKMIHIAEVTVIMRSNKLIKTDHQLNHYFLKFYYFFIQLKIQKKFI